MSNFIGPALPPHLQRKLKLDESKETSKSEQREISNDVIGPVLPSELINRLSPAGTDSKDEISQVHSLSFQSHDIPHFQENEFPRIGPALPLHLKEDDTALQISQTNSKDTNYDDDSSVLILDAEMSDEESYKDNEMYGPALPPDLRIASTIERGRKLDNFVADSDKDVVGPIPLPEGTESTTYIQQQVESRALRMKRKLAEESESEGLTAMKRESWMLELPPDRMADFGLGPRQFRTRPQLEKGDRSVWTDTPTNCHQKKHLQEEKSSKMDDLERREIDERDRMMQCRVEEHSEKNRKISLLESHQKKLKKKKKKDREEGKTEERRPFDRNIDLLANRFDESQKKAIFKKAQLLNDRFASGQSKFL
ncbi:GPALPP motifs-containing protein 1 [Periplaneta americana]|uniref:GPALPP motifs-containing protein 1 n=1 Tax=Periplaneta americana TaxID=6978 RepID=UPI0037E83A8A